MFIYLVIFAITLWLGYSVFRKKNLPPGPYGLPIVGYSPFLGKNPVQTITGLKKKYGNVIRVNLGFTTIVFLNDYEAVKEAFVKQGDIFSGRPFMFIPQTIFEKNDIIFTEGATWKERRRFSLQTLKDVGVGQTSLESIIVEQVEKLSEHLMTKNGNSVQITDLFFIPVMNIIWGICAGKTFDINDEYIKSFKTAFDDVLDVGMLNIINFFPILRHIIPGGFGYDKMKISTQKIKQFLAKEVDNHMEHFDETNMKDFMDHFSSKILSKKKEEQHMPPFNKRGLVCTVLDLFIAGSDAIAHALSFAILYLARRPEIQKKVQEELDKFIGKDSHMSNKSKKLLPYTEATLLETQRYSTIAPFPVPHRTTKDTTLLGYDIPKNTTVFANLHAMHNDEEYWGDPETFRPERFLDEFGKVRKHEPFAPFSLGPRMCLGESLSRLEMFLFFTIILRRFTFEVNPNEPEPTEDPVISVFLKPRPFTCIIKCR